MRLYNAIKNLDLKKLKNALGAVQKCIAGVFMLDLVQFLEIFDKLLMDSGDHHDLVYMSSDDNEGDDHPGSRMNMNRPTDDPTDEAGHPITERNFQKKHGHKVDANLISDNEGGLFSP